ncbi:NAD(P)H-dependent oxidoreductase [Amycolatopsis endophytica]|uniref:NAD(P)H-dependent FMN reductase n=1 Tax=Amycolatopsis endophytica TaxID=860233 RepID=A0A853B9A2_9PSEU|nr:NAD(P)H-dependent oxidoreductase [Amycolatopsis endophytica]NYI91898.1 NAD(P)H-dependent FMN reductase [Amycolatopsis endophytica]
MDEVLKVLALIGSTREGRAGRQVGQWFAKQARERDDLELAVADLADFEFPARYPARATPGMTAFTSEIDRADAFVVVTPEYNRSFPASLKQAIDFAYDEWQAKPVAFVSYGCRCAGLYAVEQLRVVFTELHTVTLRNTVSFNLFDTGPDGGPRDEAARQSVGPMLDQLVWWGHALRAARRARPYVA